LNHLLDRQNLSTLASGQLTSKGLYTLLNALEHEVNSKCSWFAHTYHHPSPGGCQNKSYCMQTLLVWLYAD